MLIDVLNLTSTACDDDTPFSNFQSTNTFDYQYHLKFVLWCSIIKCKCRCLCSSCLGPPNSIIVRSDDVIPYVESTALRPLRVPLCLSKYGRLFKILLHIVLSYSFPLLANLEVFLESLYPKTYSHNFFVDWEECGIQL